MSNVSSVPRMSMVSTCQLQTDNDKKYLTTKKSAISFIYIDESDACLIGFISSMGKGECCKKRNLLHLNLRPELSVQIRDVRN